MVYLCMNYYLFVLSFFKITWLKWPPNWIKADWIGDGLIILGLPKSDLSSEVVVPLSLSKIDTVTSKSLFWDILEFWAGVEDGLGGWGHLAELVKGGEWNNLFEGDKLGEDDLLKGVLWVWSSKLLFWHTLELFMLGGVKAMAGGKGWWTGVLVVPL